MRHPTDGTLRRLVDEPAGVADADREHVGGCEKCVYDLAALRVDVIDVSVALGVDIEVDIDAGWHRLTRALDAEEPAPVAAQPRPARSIAPTRPPRTPGPARPPRWRPMLRSPVIAAIGVAALLTGAGAAAAADWLQIFRPERVAPITISQDDLDALEAFPDEFSAYGEVQRVEGSQPREVPDATAAGQATGLPVPQVDELPDGVTGEPTYLVRDRTTTLFTFSADKAAATVAATGATLPPPPPGLDGSQFRLSNGPWLSARWTEERGVPSLLVARSAAPTVLSSGVSFDTARDYVLSLPGLPPELADQLRSLSGDGTTLPLRVLSERMTSSPADVNGLPATVLTSRDGVLSGVVWVSDGVITTVAGSLSADEVLTVARGLR